MPQKHSPPIATQDMLRRWKALANGDDPVESAVGQHLLDAWKHTRPAREREEQDERPPASWARRLGELIDTDEQHWSDTEHFKTGHSLAHGSRSGTCLSVNLARGLWYCSSCRQGGDAVGWLVQHQGVTRGQAWIALRKRFGDANAQA